MFYINLVLFPLLDGLTWYTKKYLDYCDFKLLVAILNKGFQYRSEGTKLIEIITGQTNNYRLSSYLQKTATATASITYKADVDKLLSQPSNYEIRGW